MSAGYLEAWFEARFGRAERHATLEWMNRRARVIFQDRRSRGRRSFDAARRRAAESWLRCQGLITVAVNAKASPDYPERSIRNRMAEYEV